MRLIDADALKDSVKIWLKTIDNKPLHKLIDEQPTIEAKEAVHGEWERVSGWDKDNNAVFECTNCRHGDIHAKGSEVPYCWFCGADMRKKVDCMICKECKGCLNYMASEIGCYGSTKPCEHYNDGCPEGSDMNLPQTMCFNGYVIIQNTNHHVTVKTIEDNRSVAHFQCDHGLDSAELIKMVGFVDGLRKQDRLSFDGVMKYE